jgi:hypothetical protein
MSIDMNEIVSGAVGAVSGLLAGVVGQRQAAKSVLAQEFELIKGELRALKDEYKTDLTHVKSELRESRAAEEKCLHQYRELCAKHDQLAALVRGE